MVNKVTLIGNLGADPEVRALENGVSVARISVATNESYKDNTGNWQDKTEWHTVVAWRLLAERAQTSFKKGMTVYVEGKLQTRKWQDQNGQDKYTTEVVASYMRIINRGGNSSGGGGNFPSAQDAPTAMNNTPAAPAAPSNPTSTAPTTTDAGDDDLPF